MGDLVSIIIPVYNGANYMREAIDSALGQSYENVEVVVVNDGSNDDGATDNIALEYGDKIRYFRKENGGVSSALNLGIKLSRGSWISWLSHDDRYGCEKIASQMAAIESSGASGEKLLCLCGVSYIDAEGNNISVKRQNFLQSKLYSGTEMLRKAAMGVTVGGCALLIPKSAFEEVGYFDESMKYVQDADMWVRLYYNGYQLLSVPEARFCFSRIHDQQGQSTLIDLWQPECKVYFRRLAGLIMDRMDDPDLVRSMALHCYKVGNFSGGDSALELLEDLGVRGLRGDKIIRYRFCGHLYQMARKLYHRLFHGFAR